MSLGYCQGELLVFFEAQEYNVRDKVERMVSSRESGVWITLRNPQESENRLSASSKELHSLDGVSAFDMRELGGRVLLASYIPMLMKTFNMQYINNSGRLTLTDRVIHVDRQEGEQVSIEEGYYALNASSLIYTRQPVPDMPLQLVRVGFGIVNGGERIGCFMNAKNDGGGYQSEEEAFTEIIDGNLSLDIQSPDTIEEDSEFYISVNKLAESLISMEYAVKQSQFSISFDGSVA